jgi:malate dehydrogenase
MNRVSTILGQMAPTVNTLSINNTSSVKKPLNVVVTGAAGNIAYSLIFMVAHGDMLGTEQPINLTLLDIPQSAGKMEGVVMEVKDCAYPLVNSLKSTTDYAVAFKDCDVAMLVGARPRGPGMVRADLLKANAAIFVGQGKALEKYASRDVKVCVVGNPANTNALIAMKNAPSLPRENFTAMTRLDQNRAYAQLADKTGVHLTKMSNVAIYGNHSITQYPNVSHGVVADLPYPNQTSPVTKVVNDDSWLQSTFLTTVQKRGAAIIKARKGSSAASAAKAAVDHTREWLLGTPAGTVSSMSVISDGNPYGIPEDIIYSFPCVCANGKWTIVGGLEVSAYDRKLMDATAAELVSEKAAALSA